MTKEKMRELVDKGFQLKSKLDLIEAELDKIKSTLKAEAKVKKLSFIQGNKHFASIGPTSSTECSSKDLYDLLDGDDQFFDLVKPLVGDTKEAIGETAFGSISETKSFAFNKIQFKENTPKKYL